MKASEQPSTFSNQYSEHTSVTVHFVLLEHFSMASFTGAVDALLTANSIQHTLFSITTIGVEAKQVKSDIGIDIATDYQIASSARAGLSCTESCIIVVCGGYRSPLVENTNLTNYLVGANKHHAMICSLWNGAIHLAHAAVINDHKTSLHPANHAYFKEKFPLVELSHNNFVVVDKRASSSGTVSSIEMMMSIIGTLKGEDIARAIREIISCDKLPETQDSTPLRSGEDTSLPTILRSVIQLMRNNIDEPLSPREISSLLNLSTRKIQRLFQTYFETTPTRYYLGIRIDYARQLLQQSEYEIIDIAQASGFVSISHFSSCYRNHYGISPSETRQKDKQFSQP